jgi:alanyl-tRNA synthetase
MNSDTIRQAFIDYFAERGHLYLPSLSLVPSDPSVTTLFTIAGMQQMIGYFTGREEPPARRLVTVQRAIRTVDIDEVGDDSHNTFLEMLGNFSVGDYFKHEAIEYTWDFLTRVMGIPAERWWATIYPGDEEARQAWLDVGMPAERIGETEENWWDQGPVGPAGTDSEIHYDRGVEYSCGKPDCTPENECCARFLETWNNVFMVYYQDESGERRPLPWKNIDTGMGFERLVTIVQGKESPYETDLFLPIIQRVEELSGVRYAADEHRRSFRIIADHSRAISFMIADGVMPAAEGRGYVLRRLLRRAVMHGRLLGIERPFVTEPAAVAMDRLKGYYRELHARRERVLRVIADEEQRFLRTLSRGLGMFEELAERAAHDGNVIDGRNAFVLSDTYGFPLELTIELASERGLRVDEEGYGEALREQQERAREHRKGGLLTLQVGTSPQTYATVAEQVPATVFTGHDELVTPAEVAAIIVEGQPVGRAQAGDVVEIILTATPFYAESGGQVGDTGTIRGDNGVARVLDTQRPHAALIAHRAEVVGGSIAVGDAIEARVDEERRLHILPHHSGTHLLHKALQEVLGPEATQAGSLVAPDRLRFDFRWPRPLTDEELREVQDRVNAAIWANLPVRKETMPFDEAIRSGAMALFGEKYGDRVRVVSMGDWSRELCGGTHVGATGDIGLLLITSETGIGSGVRRIEALAGAAAYAYVVDLEARERTVADLLGAQSDSVQSRVEHIMRELRDAHKQVEDLTRRLAQREAESLLRQQQSIDQFSVVADTIKADSAEYLEATTDAVASRLDPGIVILGSVVDGKGQYTMAVTGALRERGFQAHVILREAAQRAAAGGAGGKADFAKGGSKDPSKVRAVLDAAVDLIRQKAEA